MSIRAKVDNFLLTVRNVTMGMIVGMGVGAYGMHNFDLATIEEAQANLKHVMNDLVLKGGCAQPDMDHKARWFPCTDYYAELGIQQHQMELESASLSAINEAELAKQPRKVRAPKEPIPAKLFAR